MSMITAALWVPRGAAAEYPVKYDVDDQELSRIAKLAKLQLNDAEENLKDRQEEERPDAEDENTDTEDERPESNGVRSGRSAADADDDLKEYDLEHYDSEEKDEDGNPAPMFGNARSLAYYDSNADDPYITMKANADDDDEEEREELRVLRTDNMVVAAKVEDEVPYLEIYVYEDEADNLYVHHDIMLPAIPLAVEWLDLPIGRDSGAIDKSSRGNCVAVGTMDPDIELWDLDTIDSMYPNAILGAGGEEDARDGTAQSSTATAAKKKKRKKSKKANDDYHVDAVLSLAANRQHRNLLASASADQTVKLWDLNTTKCAKSYTQHTDKVCSIAWNPRQSTVLLSGSYDRTVVAADMRATGTKHPTWGVESDVETVIWDPHDANHFYITTERGMLHMMDVRKAPSRPEKTEAIWQLQAHDEAISSIDINPVVPGFIATGSSDKTVKLWNVQAEGGPSMVVSRNGGVGRVFSTRFGADAAVAFRLAIAGSKGALQVWDTSTNAGVRRVFANRMGNPAALSALGGEDKEERIIAVAEDSSDDEDGGEDGDADADGGVDIGKGTNGKKVGPTDTSNTDGWESMDED